MAGKRPGITNARPWKREGCIPDASPGSNTSLQSVSFRSTIRSSRWVLSSVGIFGKKLENLCGGRPETIEEAGRERKRKAVLLFFLLLKANRMPFVSRS
jgi:hypothetical protein